MQQPCGLLAAVQAIAGLQPGSTHSLRTTALLGVCVARRRGASCSAHLV